MNSHELYVLARRFLPVNQYQIDFGVQRLLPAMNQKHSKWETTKSNPIYCLQTKDYGGENSSGHFSAFPPNQVFPVPFSSVFLICCIVSWNFVDLVAAEDGINGIVQVHPRWIRSQSRNDGSPQRWLFRIKSINTARSWVEKMADTNISWNVRVTVQTSGAWRGAQQLFWSCQQSWPPKLQHLAHVFQSEQELRGWARKGELENRTNDDKHT